MGVREAENAAKRPSGSIYRPVGRRSSAIEVSLLRPRLRRSPGSPGAGEIPSPHLRFRAPNPGRFEDRTKNFGLFECSLSGMPFPCAVCRTRHGSRLGASRRYGSRADITKRSSRSDAADLLSGSVKALANGLSGCLVSPLPCATRSLESASRHAPVRWHAARPV
jgi:hypothetical protein